MRGARGGSLGWAVAWSLAAAGCGEKPPAPAAPSAVPPSSGPAAAFAVPTLPKRASYEVLPVGEDWGAIEGTVTLGRALEPSQVRPTKCEDVSWAEHESDLLRCDRERLTLAQAVVFLLHIERGKDWPEAMRAATRTHTLTLRDGFLKPSVAWVRRGTRLEFVNESQKMQSQWKVWRLGLADLLRRELVCNVMVAPASRLVPSDEMLFRGAGPHLVEPDV